MTFLNTYNTRNQSIIHSPDKPDAIQDTHLSPPARIGQNSAKSLDQPSNNGDISFKVIEETHAGGMPCRLSNIKSGQAGYRVTVDNARGNYTDIELKTLDGKSLKSILEKLGEGGYRATILHNKKGEPVCQLKENAELKGGGDIKLPSWWPGLFDPPLYHHYSRLAAMMKPEETVRIRWQRMTKEDCYRKALELMPRPTPARVYLRMAARLEPGRTVKAKGESVTQRSCAREALWILQKKRPGFGFVMDHDLVNDLDAIDFNILGAVFKPGEIV